jgi:Putative zinc-finger
MITDRCDPFRGMIAVEVVGQLSDHERVALIAHLDGCPACRDERRDLMALATVLPAADPDRLDETRMPLGLQATVLDRLRDDARHDRRRRRARYVVGSVAAAVVAAVALIVTLAWPGPQRATVALSAPPGIHASAVLKAETWGTALDLRESGQPAGQILFVSMRTESGSWWELGTYQTVGSSVHVTMACALKLAQIDGVWVRDSSGHVVLQGYLGHSAPTDHDTLSHHATT